MPKTPRTIVTVARHFNPNITPIVPQSYSISEHLLTPIPPTPLYRTSIPSVSKGFTFYWSTIEL